jgi:hypothetical protein
LEVVLKTNNINKKRSIENLTDRFKDLLTGISPDKLPGIYSIVYDCLENNALYFAQIYVDTKQYEKLKNV